MAKTYEPIATQTVTGSATGTITFSSIPSTYSDIVVVCKFLKTTSDNISINFNGDTTSIYSETFMTGNGSSATSSRESGAPRILLSNGIGDGTNGMEIIVFKSYANTSVYKSILSRNGDSSIGTGAGIGLWRSFSAISSFSLNTQSYNPWNPGSTFTIYGIKAA